MILRYPKLCLVAPEMITFSVVLDLLFNWTSTLTNVRPLQAKFKEEVKTTTHSLQTLLGEVVDFLLFKRVQGNEKSRSYSAVNL